MVVAASKRPARTSVGLAERDDVLGTVDRLFARAGAGRGGALFVIGAAGLGKTTVLEHAITTAKPHFVVRIGYGDQVKAVLPFGLIGQALDQILEGAFSRSITASSSDTGAISAKACFL